MVLSVKDHRALLKGFETAGFLCTHAPSSATNPITIEWRLNDGVRRYRLWAFDVTHGGGGSEVRAADEFRIQITNGPGKPSEFDQDHTSDLLIGYSRDRDAIIAYDRRWLENWSRKKAETGSSKIPSPRSMICGVQISPIDWKQKLRLRGVRKVPLPRRPVDRRGDAQSRWPALDRPAVGRP
jgi:hypothetical protein